MPSQLNCVTCGVTKPRADFSKRQASRPITARCADCIATTSQLPAARTKCTNAESSVREGAGPEQAKPQTARKRNNRHGKKPKPSEDAPPEGVPAEAPRRNNTAPAAGKRKPAAAKGVPMCSDCGVNRSKKSFSAVQLKKTAGPRCQPVTHTDCTVVETWSIAHYMLHHRGAA